MSHSLHLNMGDFRYVFVVAQAYFKFTWFANLQDRSSCVVAHEK